MYVSSWIFNRGQHGDAAVGAYGRASPPAVGAAQTCAPKTATSNSNYGPCCPLLYVREYQLVVLGRWHRHQSQSLLSLWVPVGTRLSRTQLDAAGRREGEYAARDGRGRDMWARASTQQRVFMLAWTCFGPRRRAARLITGEPPKRASRLVMHLRPLSLLLTPPYPARPPSGRPHCPRPHDSFASRLPGRPRCPVCPTAQLPRVPWPASLPPLLPGLLAPPPPRRPRPVISAAIGELGGWRPLRVRRQAREGAMAHLTTRRGGGRYAGGRGADGALPNTWHVPLSGAFA